MCKNYDRVSHTVFTYKNKTLSDENVHVHTVGWVRYILFIYIIILCADDYSVCGDDLILHVIVILYRVSDG